MNNKLSKKILNKIEHKKIKLKSKLFFSIKYYIFWILVLFAMVMLSFLFTSLFSHIQQIDFSIADKVSGGKFYHFMLFFPYSLLFLLIIVFIISIENFFHTKYAYRIEIKTIFLTIFFSALVISGFLILFADTNKIEETLQKGSFGIYHSGHLRRKQMWVQPENGLLAGSIISLTDDMKNFDFIDFSGKIWSIDISNFKENDILILNTSKYISLYGELQDSEGFKVCIIQEWEKKKTFQKNERNYFKLRSNKCN